MVYGPGGLWVLLRGGVEGGATNLRLAPKAVSDALGPTGVSQHGHLGLVDELDQGTHSNTHTNTY